MLNMNCFRYGRSFFFIALQLNYDKFDLIADQICKSLAQIFWGTSFSNGVTQKSYIKLHDMSKVFEMLDLYNVWMSKSSINRVAQYSSIVEVKHLIWSEYHIYTKGFMQNTQYSKNFLHTTSYFIMHNVDKLNDDEFWFVWNEAMGGGMFVFLNTRKTYVFPRRLYWDA